MVPRTITTLDRLPTTPNGKVDRRALVTAETERAAAPAEAHVDARESRIVQAWREVLGVGDIGLDDNFFDLGGDSFAAIQAMLALDESMPVVELFKNQTVRQLAALLRSEPVRETGLLYELTPAGRQPELTLVCVPYGGGNVVAYQPLADRLPDRFGVWAVNLPGHDPSTVDDGVLSVAEAARRCATEVQTRITGPVAVYGQCTGAALAVELARELEARGADVRCAYVGAWLTDPDPADSLRAEQSTSDEEAYDSLCSLGAFDGHLAWAEVSHILRAARNDMIASSTFFQRSYAQPPRKLTTPLRCIFGDRDPATPDYEYSYHGWELFAENVSLDVIPGAGHYFVRDRVAELVSVIERDHPAVSSDE
jgi:surfactin synthase thioesterase subunit